MFTGLIEETGTIVSFRQNAEYRRLVIRADLISQDCNIGDSIAVNGCCLTVVTLNNSEISFDLLDETIRLTSFRNLQSGSLINLERALAVGSRLGGHFVSGHIDTTGEIAILDKRGNNIYIEICTDKTSLKYLIRKGSIAIDGISLTVAEVTESGFSVWIIPHTLEKTNLRNQAKGMLVNLEFDMLAKYAERLLLKS